MSQVRELQQRLEDSRSGKVVFLSHCILNENTRYLGGACRGSCVSEIVNQCVERDLGIVQLPCPEQRAWGGVNKRWLLMTYGSEGTLLDRMRRLLLPLFLLYTKLICRRLAKATARQIDDYLTSGYSVAAVVGVDGSPSCGVGKTLDFDRSLELVAGVDIDSLTVEQMNGIVRQGLANGRGLFTAALQDELKQRRIGIP